MSCCVTTVRLLSDTFLRVLRFTFIFIFIFIHVYFCRFFFAPLWSSRICPYPTVLSSVGLSAPSVSLHHLQIVKPQLDSIVMSTYIYCLPDYISLWLTPRAALPVQSTASNPLSPNGLKIPDTEISPTFDTFPVTSIHPISSCFTSMVDAVSPGHRRFRVPSSLPTVGICLKPCRTHTVS